MRTQIVIRIYNNILVKSDYNIRFSFPFYSDRPHQCMLVQLTFSAVAEFNQLCPPRVFIRLSVNGDQSIAWKSYNGDRGSLLFFPIYFSDFLTFFSSTSLNLLHVYLSLDSRLNSEIAAAEGLLNLQIGFQLTYTPTATGQGIKYLSRVSGYMGSTMSEYPRQQHPIHRFYKLCKSSLQVPTTRAGSTTMRS